jgi:hypothetical protein
MTKKILTSLVAAAALATSTMAYEVSETASMKVDSNNTAQASNSTLTLSSTTSNSLLFPAFFTDTGWESTVRVINTDSTRAVVAKVVLYDGTDSHEVKDFNIYLSADDEWVGNIKIVNGVATISSTDGSAPVERTASTFPMASATTPMTASLGTTTKGYIEVIGMVEGKENTAIAGTTTPTTARTSKYASYHGQHSKLREDYATFSTAFRNLQTGAIFSAGVIQGDKANYPFVDLNSSNTDVNFQPLASKGLSGDIRITNVSTGTDMVMPAINIDYGSDTNRSLVYLEGEKANLADIYLDYNGSTNNIDYNATAIDIGVDSLSSTNAFITYGDATVNNNYALFTSPFKRTLAQLRSPAKNAVNPTKGTLYFDNADLNNDATNYGSFSLTATIFDMDENSVSMYDFSPATTPTIVVKSELDSSGTDLSDATKLPYYLNAASSKGYTKGYVKLQNTMSGKKIPAIVTHMMATTAGSATVTSWVKPTTK